MITPTLIDLCKKWEDLSIGERYEMAPILHDAFCDAGYPNLAAYHLRTCNHQRINGCIEKQLCVIIRGVLDGRPMEEEPVSYISKDTLLLW